MSTLMIKSTSTSEKIPNSSSSKKVLTSKSDQEQEPSSSSSVTLPKPRSKKLMSSSSSSSSSSEKKKVGVKKKVLEQESEPVIGHGGQVLASKLPVIGPPVIFDLEQLRLAFSLLDVNGDGLINADELMDMLNRLGFKDFINENIVRSLIKDATQDGDFLISEEQFVSWMPRLGLTGAAVQNQIAQEAELAQNQSRGQLKSSSSQYRDLDSSACSSSNRKSSTSSLGQSSLIGRRSSSSSSSNYSSCSSSSSSKMSNVQREILDEERKKSLEEDESEKDLRAAFAVFDADHNGFITRDELINAMTVLGEHLTEKDIDDLLNKADTDKDGQINYEEFIQALM